MKVVLALIGIFCGAVNALNPAISTTSMRYLLVTFHSSTGSLVFKSVIRERPSFRKFSVKASSCFLTDSSRLSSNHFSMEHQSSFASSSNDSVTSFLTRAKSCLVEPEIGLMLINFANLKLMFCGLIADKLLLRRQVQKRK